MIRSNTFLNEQEARTILLPNTRDSALGMWVTISKGQGGMQVSLASLFEEQIHTVWSPQWGAFVPSDVCVRFDSCQMYTTYCGVVRCFNLDPESGNVWDPAVGFKMSATKPDAYDKIWYKDMKKLILYHQQEREISSRMRCVSKDVP